jgi:F-type H+-transporting ATPase subunit epsilon
MMNTETADTTIDLIHLKILLPFKVFADIKGVRRLVVETSTGSHGFLPRRLDGTAALVAGILEYETEAGDIIYMAVDEGILVKSGNSIKVSVRNAIGGVPLGELRMVVEKEMMKSDESEKSARLAMAKLESGFIRNFQNLIKD